VIRPKRGKSPDTRRRHALRNLADLAARRDKLARSRPRTSGKKAAKTRAVNKLDRRIRAAKAQVTKALRAIARAAAERTSAKSAAKQRRSEAAKRGWARAKAAREAPAAPARRVRTMRFLEERDGQARQIFVDPPSKADRSAIGSYWYAIGVFRDTGAAALLDRFERRSIYDALRGKHLRFITDRALLLEAIASGLSDFDDLYAEIAWASAA
jgi:hypothetical protein